ELSGGGFSENSLPKLFSGGAQHFDFEKWVYFSEPRDDRLIVAGGRRRVPDDLLFLLGISRSRREGRLCVSARKTCKQRSQHQITRHEFLPFLLSRRQCIDFAVGSRVFAIKPVEFAELDAHHILGAFAHQALFARRLDHARNQFRRARGVLLIRYHMNGKKSQVMIAEAVVLPSSVEKLLGI